MRRVTGLLTTRLRPLRIAFIVQSGDENSALEAIRINNTMWGGQFNPIISTSRRLPAWMIPAWGRPIPPKRVFENIISLFDPDFIVRLANPKDAPAASNSYKELTPTTLTRSAFKAGVGIDACEIAAHIAHEEFRFHRVDSLRFDIPAHEKSIFFSAVFGTPQKEQERSLIATLEGSSRLVRSRCDFDNYTELFDRNVLFPSRITRRDLRALQRSGRRTRCIYVLDADKVADVLLFWNLRALGWDIVPIPIQSIESPSVRAYAAHVFEEPTSPQNPHLTSPFHVKVLGGPSCSGETTETFLKRLRAEYALQHLQANTYVDPWIPRYWDPWATTGDGLDLPLVVSAESNTPVEIIDGNFEFEPLLPAFASPDRSGDIQCANELDLQLFDDEYQYAQVVPEGGKELAWAAHSYTSRDMRCSRSSVVFYPRASGWSQSIQAAESTQVLQAWLKERGLDCELSDKGHVTKQLLRQIGGRARSTWLHEEAILSFLMAIPSFGSINSREFHKKLNIICQGGHRLPKGHLSKWLIESKIVTLGVDVQCPRCQQHSWHSLKEIDYHVTCRQCLEQFRVPSESPERMPWAYRGSGAFGSKVEVVTRATSEDAPLPAKATVKVGDGLQGGLAVLLLLHHLTSHMSTPITPLLSFTTSIEGQKMEIDLAALVRHTRGGIHQDDVIFAECKSFGGHFTQKEIRRMEKLSSKFPGAVIIFATLRRRLTEQEKKLITPFAKRGRKRLDATRTRAPVVILTGTELFSWNDVRGTWKELGPPHSLFQNEFPYGRVFASLADATQHLYLDLPSGHLTIHR